MSDSSSTAASSSSPTPCKNGCGFFGNPRTESYCSKCYREKLARESTVTGSSPSFSAATLGGTSALTAALAQSSLSPAMTSSASTPDTVSPAPTAFTPSTVPIVTPSATSALPPIPASPAAAASTDAGTAVSATTSTPSPFSLSITTTSSPSRPIDIPSAAASVAPTSASPATSHLFGSSPPSGGGQSSSPLSSSPLSSSPNKARKRCFVCSKKLALDFFTCRCDESHFFCAQHRLPHAHHCPYDHRKEQQSKVEKANPVIKPSKLEHI